MKRKTVLIALGGNAIIKKGEEETYSNLIKNIKIICENLIPIIKNNKVIITHGNGSEIGFILLQNELARRKVPPMPLDILGAESQGLIGYPLEEQLLNRLRKHRIDKHITTILTQTLVNKNDTAFKDPTKFIGPFYTKKQTFELIKRGMKIKEDQGRGYRRVVSSPKPIKILEADSIKDLLKQDSIVIAAGGGGIPVIKDKKGNLKGVEAVIDKDLASSCLAKSIKVDIMLILTGVHKVPINFRKKNQKYLDKLNIKTAEYYMKQGQFPPGNMGPKIEAAIDFIKSGKGKKVIITSPENALKALKGKTGTLIVK
ncbi:carbamate kinase [Candidatus Woesearchaeota archaeon]|nr:carbamate kinase [Candidatus Woesearchaeota archaeon]